MRNGTPCLSSFGRVLALLDAILCDDGQSRIPAIAQKLGTPLATAHRHVASLVDEGMLTMAGNGRYVAGPRLMHLARAVDVTDVLSRIALPILSDFAGRIGCVVQLGTLDGEMVTYRAKAGGALFTRVGMQLEAYCSAIGKVLLAHLPPDAQATYLAGGPFVRLTGNTITDPAALACEFEAARSAGHACDREEIVEGLACIALPVRDDGGRAVAAISASLTVRASEYDRLQDLLPDLEQARDVIEVRAFGAAFATGRYAAVTP